MPQAIDVAGQRFGTLVAVSVISGRVRKWLCICDCGHQVARAVGELRLMRRGTRCPKCAPDRHGATSGGVRTKEHRAWASMIRRCTNPGQRSFSDYGARGIRVCEEWRHDFSAFLRAMGPAPSPQHTLERIDNDGDYEPSNCRWATRAEQAVNKRNNRVYTVNGETMTMKEWSRRCGVNYKKIWQRVTVYGWSIERALAA